MRILIIGSGGHAKVVIEACELQGKYKIAGLLDDFAEVGKEVLGYKVLGAVNDFERLMKEQNCQGVFVAVGDNFGRGGIYINLYQSLVKNSWEIASIIHPTAQVSKTAHIKKGCFVGANTVINSHSRIGQGCIVNTSAVIEHDSEMLDMSSLAPNSVIGGNCKIGQYSHVGLGACVNNKVAIGIKSVVGSGSAVTSAIPDECVAYGNPCKFIHWRAEDEPYL